MDDAAPCFTRLQVIRDLVPRAGGFNMALDEVLLAAATDVVVLRLYLWLAPTISFGYFELSASANVVARGRETVRRWTGGGIVEHGEDLTYSLCVPRSCAFAGLRGAESYRRIHAAVASALRRCGTPADLSGTGAPGLPNAVSGNVCFERPVPHDLLVGGQKIAGGAQRRTRAGLLHQGSIQLSLVNAGTHAAPSAGLWRELPPALANLCDERSLTETEISQASALALAKYSTAAWTNRF